MRVSVFGATGASGQLVVRRLLGDGHQVVAFARTPSKLDTEHPALDVIAGELDDAEAIDGAIAGADAVISLLGPGPRSKGTGITDGTRRIVKAMDERGVRRLVATATPSASDPADGRSLPFQLAVASVRRLLPHSYREIVGTADVIRSSGLDWTLVRLPMLTEKPGRGPVAGHIGDDGIKLLSLSRPVLADFLVDQLADETWLRKAPVISNAR